MRLSRWRGGCCATPRRTLRNAAEAGAPVASSLNTSSMNVHGSHHGAQ